MTTPATLTRENFIAAYRRELLQRYTWAHAADKMERFMDSVTDTLDGKNTWLSNGDAVTAAWRYIGGKGKPTLKALRALT